MERSFGIPLFKWKSEDIEKGWIHIGPDLIELSIFMRDQSSEIADSDRIQDLRKILFERRPYRDRNHGPFHAIILIVHKNAVDVIGVFMKPVVVEFVLNPQEDQNANGHTYG
jgi:hypothetical protein